MLPVRWLDARGHGWTRKSWAGQDPVMCYATPGAVLSRLLGTAPAARPDYKYCQASNSSDKYYGLQSVQDTWETIIFLSCIGQTTSILTVFKVSIHIKHVDSNTVIIHVIFSEYIRLYY